MRRVGLKALILLILGVFLAFVPLAAQGGRQVELRDATGRLVKVPLHPRRVVSLIPSVTEMVAYLGYLNRLVGRSRFCDFPPEVRELPVVGDMLSVDLERLAQLRPDLILVAQGNDLEMVEKMRDLGLAVFALDEPADLGEIHDQLELLANILGRGPRAEHALGSFKARLRLLLMRAKKFAQPPQVFVSYSGFGGEVWVAGKGTYLDGALSETGLNNATGDLAKGWFKLDRERLAELRPEVVVIPLADPADEEARLRAVEELEGQPEVAEWPAVRKRRYYFAQANRLFRPGPRLLDELLSLQEYALAQFAPQEEEALAAGAGGGG